MPAIHPQRLQSQADQLAQAFDRPAVLLPRLHDLLERYADRTRRPAQSGRPVSVLPAYHAPRPVLRAVIVALQTPVRRDPDRALTLCDALWDDAWLETRLLAAWLIGLLPPSGETLDRADRWVLEESDEQIIQMVVDEGLRPARQAHPDRLLRLAEDWLTADDLAPRTAALNLLTALIREPAFENLPPLVRMVTPLLKRPLMPLRPELERLLTALAERWPSEAAYLLRRLENQTPAARALARRLRPLLPKHFW